MSRRWYWKVYLILIASMTVGGIGLSFYWWEETVSLDRIAEWISLPMHGVQLAGLFGFVYFRRIGSSVLWKFVFAATVVELAWMTYEMTTDAGPFSSSDFAILAAITVVGVVMLLPLLVALYVYAFRSRELWAKAT
jgi:hypothetical protein